MQLQISAEEFSLFNDEKKTHEKREQPNLIN